MSDVGQIHCDQCDSFLSLKDGRVIEAFMSCLGAEIPRHRFTLTIDDINMLTARPIDGDLRDQILKEALVRYESVGGGAVIEKVEIAIDDLMQLFTARLQAAVGEARVDELNMVNTPELLSVKGMGYLIDRLQQLKQTSETKPTQDASKTMTLAEADRDLANGRSMKNLGIVFSSKEQAAIYRKRYPGAKFIIAREEEPNQ